MPPSKKKNKKKIRHKGGDTVPNGDARKARRQVWDDGGGDAEYCDCDAEPNSEKPRSDSDWRQVKDKERAFETGKVVKPAYERHQKQTSDYD